MAVKKGDRFIEVTVMTGLTVYSFQNLNVLLFCSPIVLNFSRRVTVN